MPERENPAQARLDHDPVDGAPKEAEGRRVLDVVDEDGAIGMRLDDVTVTPAPERAAHLLVFERMRRIVRGVQRLEPHVNERDPNRDNRSAPNLEIRRGSG